MPFIRWLTATFKGGTPGFFLLESEILEEVARKLGGEEGARLRSYIQKVNLVQRLDGGREVNSYVLKSGKPTFRDSDRLIDQSGEKQLAKFTFRGAKNPSYQGEEPNFEGAVWLVDGSFFALEFSENTEHFLDTAPLALNVILCI